MLDDFIGNITQKLKDTGLYDNTVLIFSSDNGGEMVFNRNKPLAGFKGTVLEGGVRVPAFVHSPLLPANKINGHLFHITDWYPTILKMAKPDVDLTKPEYDMDGIDQSDTLNALKSSDAEDPGEVLRSQRE